jgi:hypothetical protein
MVGSDEIMTNALFLGTYPGLTQAMLEQEIEVIANFLWVHKNSPTAANSRAQGLH